MTVVEEFLQSKSGRRADCEDGYRVRADGAFICVVDGATSQSNRTWNGPNGHELTGGQMAVEMVLKELNSIPKDADAITVVRRLTSAIQREYRRAGLYELMKKDPVERATASVVIYSRHRNEVWLVGDCQALVIADDHKTELLCNPKMVDAVTASVRCFYLESQIAGGKTVAELRETDAGREFIRELLVRQRRFQNTQRSSRYSYWVLDGFPVAEVGIKVKSIPRGTRELVLATDGYPRLFPTLKATERHLKKLIRSDRLMIRDFQSTKGVSKGSKSFDDRTYVRIRIPTSEE